MICFSFNSDLVGIWSFRAHSTVRLGQPKVRPSPFSAGQKLASPAVGTAEWSTVSLFTRDYRFCPHMFAPPWTTPLGSQDCHLGSWNCHLGTSRCILCTSRCTLVHLPPLQMHFCASGSPPDALLCIWLTSRCTVVHLAPLQMHFCASGDAIWAPRTARRGAEGPVRYERAAQ